MAAIFGERNFFLKTVKSSLLRLLWVEKFNEIALSHTVKEIEANMFLHFWQKFENSK